MFAYRHFREMEQICLNTRSRASLSKFEKRHLHMKVARCVIPSLIMKERHLI